MLKYAGRDATAAYEPIHASGTIDKYLSAAQRLGAVADEVDESYEASIATQRGPPIHTPLTTHIDVQAISAPPGKRPRLSSMLSIADFTHAAKSLLPTTSYAFLSTGAEDNHSITRNHTTWQTVRLRPRVLRPIPSAPNTRRRILGNDFSAPFFVCPAGGAKLCHPQGDTLLTQAADQQGLLHWVCNNAGRSQEDIAAVRGPGQVLYWQIYAMADLTKTEAEIRSAIASGFNGFALTVDAIWAGKREGDLKARIAEEEMDGDAVEDDDAGQGFKRQPKVSRP
jgi:L-lactate dehydrogenase (cytochrome)